MEKNWNFMKRWTNWVALLFILSTTVSSCFQSEYEQMVKREQSKGIRQDSLFFGIHLGDTSKDFYARCWELNKEGVIQHGPKNRNVRYNMETENGDKIMMLFYPAFDKESKVRKMDVEFSYESWAPWNEQYKADKLLPVVRDTLETWFPGNPFIHMEFDKGIKEVWVKVDGNRRISMSADDEQLVFVKIIDMLNKDN